MENEPLERLRLPTTLTLPVPKVRLPLLVVRPPRKLYVAAPRFQVLLTVIALGKLTVVEPLPVNERVSPR